MENVIDSNAKTAAIVSYITLIGWLISYFALNKPKSSLATYHLRQTLFLMLCAVVFQIAAFAITVALPMIGILFTILSLGFLVLWVMGLISAINGEEKPMPLIGEKAQELFKNL